jgi:uncharacterized protein (TIGR02001 family)
MRKSLLSLAVLAAFAAPAIAIAQTAPAAPAAAPSPVTGNMTIASDYRFRGISQTYRGPAIQGGIDYAHDSGFYIGNWNSNVSSAVYSGGAGIEMDFYGGWKKAFGDFGLDLGFLYYYYPNAEWNARTGSTNGSKKFDNQELYVGGSWKWISAKYSYAVSDYFGLNREQAAGGYWVNQNTGAALGDHGNSKGTQYFDLTATYPVSDKFSVIGHVGKLKVKHYSDLDYTDWKLGATYDLSGWILGASVITTNAKKEWYYTAGAKGIKNTGESTIVFSVAKTF